MLRLLSQEVIVDILARQELDFALNHSIDIQSGLKFPSRANINQRKPIWELQDKPARFPGVPPMGQMTVEFSMTAVPADSASYCSAVHVVETA